MVWLTLFIIICACLYFRLPLVVCAALLLATLLSLYLVHYTLWSHWAIITVALVTLVVKPIRRLMFSNRLIPWFQRNQVSSLSTATGTLQNEPNARPAIERQLMSGRPKWLTPDEGGQQELKLDEQDFLDGPCEELCCLLDDWAILQTGELSEPVLQFMQQNGFFALLIERSFNGKQFSTFAFAKIIAKISSVSIAAGSLLASSNASPLAALIALSGSDKQKQHFLPRLASGKDIACFAPSVTEHEPKRSNSKPAKPVNGIHFEASVIRINVKGTARLAIRLSWTARDIRLTPITTMIGIVAQLKDPQRLLQGNQHLGTCCILVPLSTKGVSLDLVDTITPNIAQTGTVRGNQVLVPLSAIIGTSDKFADDIDIARASSLANSSLPLTAITNGASKALCLNTAAYARINHRADQPLSALADIQNHLANMAVTSYSLDGLQDYLASDQDNCASNANTGGMPASTAPALNIGARALAIIDGAIAVHCNKIVVNGPKNYILSAIQAAPFAMAASSNQILTDSLGRRHDFAGSAIPLNHPYLHVEHATVESGDKPGFDNALIKHIALLISNAMRSTVLGISNSLLAARPRNKANTRHYQHIGRFSANLSFLFDISFFMLGKKLATEDQLLIRLTDILSSLAEAHILLQKHSEGRQSDEEEKLVTLALTRLMYRCEQTVAAICENYPITTIRPLLSLIVLPLRPWLSPPSDSNIASVAAAITKPSSLRNVIGKHAFRTACEYSATGQLDHAILNYAETEAIIDKALKQMHLPGHRQRLALLADLALSKKLISKADAYKLHQAAEDRQYVVGSDGTDNNDARPVA